MGEQLQDDGAGWGRGHCLQVPECASIQVPKYRSNVPLLDSTLHTLGRRFPGTTVIKHTTDLVELCPLY